MCKTLKVSASSFYGWLDYPLCKRQLANAVLMVQIREAFVASYETDGMPRIRAELIDAAGIVASRKRIAALMRQEHMRGVSRRRSFCITTQRDVRHRPAPGLVKREFVATDINQFWVVDMTYIPTWTGFLYLDLVNDVYSRKVVGWAFGQRMTSDLAILALNMALMTRKPQLVIHHSDQGSQYTSIAFGNRCKEMGVRAWGRWGMHRTTRWLKASLQAWNVSWYNPRRRHSGLNYQSPNNFERKHQENTN